jgi:hypothetical protein
MTGTLPESVSLWNKLRYVPLVSVVSFTGFRVSQRVPLRASQIAGPVQQHVHRTHPCGPW